MLKSKQYVKLAQSLPPQLQRFFARYPPPTILPQTNTVNTTSDATGSATEEALNTAIHPAVTEATSPFKPHKHPITGKWHDPVFSLRRQADLCKLARQHGVEELLPLSVKSTEEKLRRRMENGLRVKGTGVGQRVKGKESERTLKSRLEKRRKAMLEMPQMIQTWKERGHGRGWKKWPK
ncbi:hypothetical protein DID88_004219 [Monilinia fructigena]|uniref:Large ribosomal subunit protein mL59 domain-containing protein n=1 Tax=Monilinia fructigena TaxID=38457 RepID=A0A395IS41_9HELO|nr:hypothetical protein DID88_004219 [Monilinia fructigena]